MQQLLVGDLRQEVGLVFHRIHCHSQVFGVAHKGCVGIMPGGGDIEVFTPALLKVAKLDHAIAHHIGIGCESRFHGAQCIFHHIVPIFLVERNHL